MSPQLSQLFKHISINATLFKPENEISNSVKVFSMLFI